MALVWRFTELVPRLPALMVQSGGVHGSICACCPRHLPLPAHSGVLKCLGGSRRAQLEILALSELVVCQGDRHEGAEFSDMLVGQLQTDVLIVMHRSLV